MKKTEGYGRVEWGVRRTASADLGTPFMPPVGFFLVRTTVGRVMGGREVRSGSRGTGRGAVASAALVA